MWDSSPSSCRLSPLHSVYYIILTTIYIIWIKWIHIISTRGASLYMSRDEKSVTNREISRKPCCRKKEVFFFVFNLFNIIYNTIIHHTSYIIHIYIYTYTIEFYSSSSSSYSSSDSSSPAAAKSILFFVSFHFPTITCSPFCVYSL